MENRNFIGLWLRSKPGAGPQPKAPGHVQPQGLVELLLPRPRPTSPQGLGLVLGATPTFGIKNDPGH